MTNPAPALKTNQIHRDVRAAYLLSDTYVERDFAYAKLAREVADLERVAPAQACAVRAQLYAFAGDLLGVREVGRELLRHTPGPTDVLNLTTAFTRLGAFADAQSCIRPLLDARAGVFSLVADSGIALGLVHWVAKEFEHARRLKLQFSHATHQHSGVQLANAMSEVGITDEILLKYLEAAGAVLQRHRKLLIGTATGQARDETGSVIAVFNCKVVGSGSELFELNVDLAAEIESRGLAQNDHLALTFSAPGERELAELSGMQP